METDLYARRIARLKRYGSRRTKVFLKRMGRSHNLAQAGWSSAAIIGFYQRNKRFMK
jgi:hypothetical protein